MNEVRSPESVDGRVGQSDSGLNAEPEAVRVLCVDDEPGLLELVEAYLERKSDVLVVEGVTSPEEALDRLATNGFDCVVSDYQMPRMDGLDFLDAVRKGHPDLPFILFTGKGSEEVAERAISAGVTDYIQKETSSDTFAVLANRIEHAVAQYRAQQEARASDRRIRRVFERITDAFVALDEEWRYTYVNQQAAEVLEHDADELLGEVLWEKFPELRETAFDPALREAMETQEPTTVEAYFEPLDVWFEARSYPAENGLSIYFRDITDRKARERRYEAIFNQTYQFTGLLEPDGTLVEANETALAFGDIDRDEVVGKKLWNAYWFQHGDAAARAREAVERARDGEFFRDEIEVRGADRTAIIDFSVKPVFDERGEVVLLVPEGRDITDLKERERALERERTRVRRLVNQIEEYAIFMLDSDGHVVSWNQGAERIKGYSEDEILGEHLSVFYPEEAVADGTPERELEIAASEGAFEDEGWRLRKDGSRFWARVTVTALRDDEGTLTGFSKVTRDMTERQERERRYEAIFNQTYQFTGLLEPDGTLLEANEAALDFGGLDREDVVGKKFWNAYWWRIDEQTQEQLREAVGRARNGEFVRYEVEVQGADRTAPIDFSLKPVTDERGNVELIVPEGRDITDLKERERELQRQNKRLDEFASVVSHELRNPLKVAQGSLELVRETGDREHVDKAERALERTETLVEDLLTLARKGQVVSETTAVDLAEAVDRARATAKARAPAVETVDPLTVEADAERFHELLENLFRNAVDHGSPDVRVEVGALPDGDGFYVADDGPGIPEDEREDVFESGYTTTEDGSGFGLAIARSIAEAHGWEMTATESDRGGARFEVRGVETG